MILAVIASFRVGKVEVDECQTLQLQLSFFQESHHHAAFGWTACDVIIDLFYGEDSFGSCIRRIYRFDIIDFQYPGQFQPLVFVVCLNL